MSKDPAVLFYTSDFLSGTMTMSNDEVGMYIKLLCLQHQQGRLKEKDMYYICSTYVESVFSKFKVDTNGMYYNERMESEAQKRKKYSDSRRKNVSKRYDSKQLRAATYVVHMENENVNENININKKNNKNNNKFIPPTLETIKKYIKEKDYLVDADFFYEYFSESNWKDVKGNKVRNWKQKLRVWEQRARKETKANREKENKERWNPN